MQILERVYDFKSYLVDCSRLLRLSGRMVLGALVYWWRYGAHCDYRCFAHFGFGKRMEDFGFGILDFRPCDGFFAMLGQAFMDYRNEKGKRGQFTASIINRIFLWLDGRLADTDDMLGWMCIVEKL